MTPTGTWQPVIGDMLPCLGIFDVRYDADGLTDLRIVESTSQRRTHEKFFCFYAPLPERVNFTESEIGRLDP